MGERLDPEQLKEVMGSFFEAMRDEIEVEGGTVEKFIGDAVMAAFGVPTAHEDDAARALRAALRMRTRLSDLNQTLSETYGLTLQMRVGVNTGDVLATTSPPPGEGMVAGDAVNVAARLEQAAEPGQILVGERTARAARPFRFRSLEPLAAKGKSEAIDALELLEQAAVPERGLPGLRAPMVGRDHELTLLDSMFRRVASEGHPHLVTIYGEAGVGKSRLTSEFIAVTERDALIFRGRSLPYGEGVTYWPMAEILKGHAGVLDTDSPEVALEKIHKLGRGLLTSEIAPDPKRATAALAYTVGVEDPSVPFRDVAPRQVRAETHSAWRAFFSALSREKPVVVVVEDIHWADPAMLDLLEDLADRVAGPVLIVCPARPELTARRPDWGGGRRSFSSVALDPLPPDEADRLVELLLAVEDLPEALHRRILERAEGNPFFLEEIIRQLIDAGRLVHEKGRWRAASGIADVEVPDTVQGVLTARIDLLAAEDKRTLQLAAVVGRIFWPGPVSRLLNGDSDDIDASLQRLEHRDLVLERVGSSMAGESEFIFKHVLTRDVAYDSLPRRDRALAHATVAQWIEETAGERRLEFVELLAHHFHQAYLLARERGDSEGLLDLRATAFGTLLAASAHARSKLASRTAAQLGERALDIAEGHIERARSLEAMGYAAQDQYEGDEAWRCFRQAAEARAAAGPETDEERDALAMACAGACETPTRWPGSMRSAVTEEEVRRYLKMAFDALPAGDSEARIRLLTVEAFFPWVYPAHQTDDEINFAVEQGEEAAAMALRMGRLDRASGAMDGVGANFFVQHRYAEVKDVLDRRMAIVDQLSDPFEVGDALSVAAWVCTDIGLYKEAIAYGERGYERTREYTPAVALHSVAWKAMAHFRLGDWDTILQDIALIEEMLEDRRDDPPYFAARPFGAAAFIHETRGNQVAADRVLGLIERLRARESERGQVVLALAALVYARRGDPEAAWSYLLHGSPEASWDPMRLEFGCDVVAELGHWDRAQEVIDRAQAALKGGGLMSLPAYIARLEGRSALAARDPEQAVSHLTKAREVFDELGARWERAWTDLFIGEALIAAGDRTGARSRLEEALAVFEELRTPRELDRARELLKAI